MRVVFMRAALRMGVAYHPPNARISRRPRATRATVGWIQKFDDPATSALTV
jgi:hypothetical protein